MQWIPILLLILSSACANLTDSGKEVRYIESDGAAWEQQEIADKIVAKHDCKYIGFIDAKASHFPGSYSLENNEIHAALRNRAAKMGANLVIANFYRKPPQGIGLLCSEEFLRKDN